MANQEHVEILKQGAEVWNKWREDNPDVEIDLISADLRHAKLDNADLCGANLGMADLRMAHLCNANLQSANLSGAYLHSASLCDANLSLARLYDAQFYHADLYGANLRGVNLSIANLSFADLSKANLTAAHLSGVDLSSAKLNHAKLNDADLRKANLIEANFSNSDITGTKIYGTPRDGWKIDGITCIYIYWDIWGEERTPKARDFRPGEFEGLYKHLPTIEYYFENGFTPIDAIVIDKVVQAINEKHPEFELKLDSFHSRGQPHAVFTILHKEYADEAIRQIKLDYETKIRVIEAERNLLERLFTKAIEQPRTFINSLQTGNFIEDKSRNIHAGGNVIDSTLVAGDGNNVTHAKNSQIGVIGDNTKIEGGINFKSE